MLHVLDHTLTLLHFLIIGFNLFGWIWNKTRKLHLISVLLTAASWMLLGIWFGLGYCPITDWQWDIKRKLGETNLPNSFITYQVEHFTGNEFDDKFIDTATAVSFIAVCLISFYLNFRKASRNN